MTALFTGYMLANFFFSSKKGLSGEENMVLGHIQVVANQGDLGQSLCSNQVIQSVSSRHMDQASQSKNGTPPDSD